MLAALAHGLGTGIGWIVGDGMMAAEETLGIPPESLVRIAISLGLSGMRRPSTSV